MATTIGQAILRLGIDDAKLRKGIGRAQKMTAKFGASMKNVGSSMTTSLTLPLLAFGTAALKVGGDFEAGMNTVAAVSGATGEQLKALKEQAKELGETTQFSATQAAEGMGFLAQAGFKANEVLAAMPKTLELAAASQMDLGQTADTVSNILSGYNLEVKDLGRVNDVLVKAFTSSNTNLQQLGEAMKFAGPVASAAGVGFEEAAAALGLMGNAGIQASMAGTSLRGAIAKALSPTDEIKEKMEALGLRFKDAKGKLLPLVDIIRQLEPHAKDAGLMMEIFGLRAGPAMAALVGQGADKLADFTDVLKNSAGTSARIAAVRMEGLNGAVKELKSAFEGLLISLAESGMLDAIADLSRRLAGVIRVMSRSNPKLLQMVTIVGAVVAALGPIIFILGQVVIAFSALMPVIAGVGGALMTLVTAGGPFALLAIAVGLWITNWEELRDGTILIVGFLAEQIPLKFQELMNNLAFLMLTLIETMPAAWQQLATNTMLIIQTLANQIPAILQAGFARSIEFLGTMAAKVIEIWNRLSNILVGNSIIPDMWSAIKKEFGIGADAVAETTLEAKLRVQRAFKGMATEMGSTMGGLTADLVKGEKSFEDFAKAAVKALAKIALQRAALAMGGPLGGFLGGFVGGFAEGGFIPPGSFGVVGEEGPELAFGGRRGLTIQSNGGGGGGSSASVTVNNNVTGMDFGSGDAVRAFMDTATREVKRGARELLEFSRASGDRNELTNRRAA